MDLDEYLFYQKKKDPTFTQTAFAKKIGISKSYLTLILKKRKSPANIAYKLWKECGDQVDIAKLIIDYFIEQDKRAQK